MTDQETTLLYALSTFAQTCAALAAFVGAVGIFRLQTLRDRRRQAERMLWIKSEALGIDPRIDVELAPEQEILDRIDRARKKFGDARPEVKEALELRSEWEVLARTFRDSRCALIGFEAWNLLLIGLALVSFNYVPWLASWRGTSWALWIAAVGTVAVTVGCVIAWTRE
jgi:hypothetical protein